MSVDSTDTLLGWLESWTGLFDEFLEKLPLTLETFNDILYTQSSQVSAMVQPCAHELASLAS